MKSKQTQMGMAAPDPAEALEQVLRKMATGNCKAMLTKLVHNVGEVPNTARVLRLIEVVANLHRQALSNFGTETAPMRRSGLYVSSGGLESNILSGGDSSDGIMQGASFGNTGETFAAQLATHRVSAIWSARWPKPRKRVSTTSRRAFARSSTRCWLPARSLPCRKVRRRKTARARRR